jgi:PAS domain S-box-containing protein
MAVGLQNKNDLTREELLEIIRQQEAQLRFYQYDDTSYRPSVSRGENNKLSIRNLLMLAQVLEQIDEIVYLVEISEDGSRTILYVSPGVQDLLGVNKEEFSVGTKVIDFCHPEDIAGIFVTAKKLRQHKTPQLHAYRYFHPLKGMCWLEEKIYPQFDRSGRYAANLGIIRDVTDKKEKESLLLQRRDEALTESQGSLRMLIDSSLDMICASDNDGIITEFNTAARETFGYTRDEILGQPVSILYAEPNNISDLLHQPPYAFAGEVLNKRKNGEIFTAYLSASALRNARGEVVGAMGVSRDITALKHAEQELKISEQKYRAIYNQAHIGMALVDIDTGNFIDTNNRLADMLGYTHDELVGKSVESFHAPGDLSRLPKGKEFIRRRFERIIDERRYYKKDGSEIILNIMVTLVRNEENEPQYFIYVYEDITPKRKAEEQIRLQSAKLNAIFESTSHMIWSCDKESRLTSFNQNQALWLKEQYGVTAFVGMSMVSGKMVSDNTYNQFWIDKAEFVFAGEPQQFETKVITPAGRVVYREIFINPIYNERNEVVEMSCIAHDITEKKIADDKLIASEQKNRAIINALPDILFTLTKDGVFIDARARNDADLFMPRDFFIGKNIKTVFPGELGKAFMKNIKTALSRNAVVEFEYDYLHNNEHRYYEIRYAKINANECMVISRDITDKKTAEQKMRASLKEKEVLLKEVHHRVKNNLQVISSILNLQSSYIKDANILEILHESQNRIKSMAFVHESLYQTKDFASINFQEYVGNISRNLVHSYSLSTAPELTLDLDPIFLNLDTSIPCGLIINELLSNALKYAFKDGRKGTIHVAVKESKNTITITIADDGVGLPKGLDYRNTESLGLQLVVTLVEQINGTIEIDQKKGTKFAIEFSNTAK